MMNYDPNLTYCGQMALQTVRLTFGRWAYRAEMTIPVRGNCLGLDVIRAALSRAHDLTCGEGESAGRLVLTDPAGNTLLDCDDDDQGQDWLENLLIGAEIIAIAPQPA